MPPRSSPPKAVPGRARPGTVPTAAARRPAGGPAAWPVLALVMAPLATGAATVHPSPLAAQELRGTVVEAATGRPVDGAFVSLLDERGVAAASVLAAADGAYVLRTPLAGTYRVRVERIGYESWISEPFPLRRGPRVTRRLEVPIRPVRLDDLAVTVESNCRPRPGAGPEMARVWEEARKALELNRWTEDESRVRFVLLRFERDVDAETGRVVREETRSAERRSWRTFVSAPPAELAAEGWVRPVDGGGWRYFGPDAEALLSDAFADGHCFTLVRGRGDETGLVGLGFEPVETRRPDVVGTLWLDPATAELRRLDFRYTELDLGIPRHEAGGSVEFARLPTGHWFVRSWVIRMPMPAERTGVALRSGPGGLPFEPRRELVLARYRHAGGEAVRADLPDGASLDLGAWGAVAGIVRDRDGAPLPDVEVALAGTSYRDRTGDDGRFRLAAVPPGEYALLAAHAGAAGLGVPGADTTVTVAREDEAEVELSLVSVGAFIAGLCAGTDVGGGEAVAFGVVRDRTTGEPAPGVRVWVARREWALREGPGGPTVDGRAAGRWVETDASGRYIACGLPAGVDLLAQAGDGGAASDPTRVRPRAGDAVRVDLELVDGVRPLAPFAAASGEPDLDAVVEEILAAPDEDEGTGLATLVGIVRAAETGGPVTGARVRLVGSGEERVTGAQGTFVMRDLPRARYRVVTERLGLASDTADVDLRAGAGARVSLVLETRPVPLPALEVEIERTFHTRRLEGYFERLGRGLGDFVTREDLEFRDVISNFRRIPSVRVQQCVLPNGLRKTRCWDLKIARGMGLDPLAPCPPLVYFDGHLLTSYAQPASKEPQGGNPFTILQKLPRDRLEGIEVYRSPGAAPARYRMLGDACGIILVWTRGR